MNSSPTPPLPHQHQQPYVAPAGEIADPDRNKWSGCLIGCLVAFGFCCVMCAGAGFYVYMNAANWATTAGRAAFQAVLQESDLPREEQTAMLDQFDRVADAYQEGEVSLEELGQIVEGIAESPVTGLVMLKAIETKYLDPSGLSDEEKEESKRTILRVVRGVIDEQLDEDDIKQITKHFFVDSTNGKQQELRPSLTDDELRALLTEAKDIVDSREVADEEDYDVKLSDVVREIVDEALQE